MTAAMHGFFYWTGVIVWGLLALFMVADIVMSAVRVIYESVQTKKIKKYITKDAEQKTGSE